MKDMIGFKDGWGVAACVAGFAGVMVAVVSCGTAPTAFPVTGVELTGNEPPTLTVLEPVANIARDQGTPFIIRWTDTDRDECSGFH